MLAASATAGRNGLDPSGDGGGRAAEVEACRVTVVDAAKAEGVIVEGEKLHVTPAGRPEQPKLTVELNPLEGVTVREAVPLWPAMMVRETGVTATEKSAGGGGVQFGL